MSELLVICIYALCSGLPIVIGGLIARFMKIRDRVIKIEINHWAIAFGGGILIASVAFALVPKAIEVLPPLTMILVFISGTLFFMWIDWVLAKSGSTLAQVMSMLMDFIPEVIALGASFAHDPKFGMLLAIFIGLQNLPEGYNAYFELREKLNPVHTLVLMSALSFSGLGGALTGYLFLTNSVEIIAALMLFSGGGIIYLMFQEIAPLSKRKGDWIPASGASLGFLIGMLGEKFLG
ncbi:MAG: divalent cation transporter [Calditrichaeota bacterium]|nr:divalent cation transporter [Calditrichota bacterium]